MAFGRGGLSGFGGVISSHGGLNFLFPSYKRFVFLPICHVNFGVFLQGS